MKVSDYQDRARKTAVYPDQYRIIYPVLKLVGEIGEYMDVFNSACSLKDLAENLKKEAGDILWYLANICCDLDVALTDCVLLGYHATFDDVAKQVETEMIDASFDNSILTHLGKIAEATGKIARDGDQPSKRHIIENGVGIVFAALLNEIANMNLSIDEIAEMNLAKLESRMKRGVIKGDGDNR